MKDDLVLPAISCYNGSAKWYKMKKVQDQAFRRVPEEEKYKLGTSHDEKREAMLHSITPQKP